MPTGNNEILEETTQITEATTEANATLSSASINMQNIDDDNKDNSSGNNDTNGSNNDLKGQICGTKLPTGTFDPTPYIQRARVTRPAPPKPSCNPMQFVQIKPCNLYQSAQEQIKRAEEVKKVKEVKKEDPEDWQNNLDNWKSSRRKRVEHIIDRVVEVKKLELEEHDRSRRKSKTFSEMLEERTTKGRTNKLASLAVYTEDESNDLSDLGIGTSSTSGKSSLSEDYDNNSVLSDNADTEKTPTNFKSDNNSNDGDLSENGGATREYISSPGYDTSSSTAPASSPDPCEYTYEGAIEDYKSRISKAVASSSKNSFNNNINNNNNNITNTNNNNNNMNSNANIYRNNKDSTTPERTLEQYLPRRMSGTKIEDRLMNFEIKSSGDANESISTSNISKKDLPKVDILKRRELFEKENSPSSSSNDTPTKERRFSGATAGADIQNTKTIRERLSSLEKKPSLEEDNKKKVNRLSGDITSIKNRLQNLEQNNNQIVDNNTTSSDKGTRSLATNKIVDVPVLSLKDRLSSLQSAVAKEEIKKPVMLIDEHQLEILKKEDFEKQQALKRISNISSNTSSTTGTTPNTIITINTTPAINTDDEQHSNSSHEILSIPDESNVDTDREDSGIHTTDVSCSVSQTDEQAELVNEENHHQHPINIDNLHHHHHHHDHEHHNNLHQNNNDHPEHNSHKLHSISNNATIINDTDKTKLSLEIVDQRNSTNDQNILSNQNKFNNAVNNSLESHETTTDNDVDISVSEFNTPKSESPSHSSSISSSSQTTIFDSKNNLFGDGKNINLINNQNHNILLANVNGNNLEGVGTSHNIDLITKNKTINSCNQVVVDLTNSCNASNNKLLTTPSKVSSYQNCNVNCIDSETGRYIICIINPNNIGNNNINKTYLPKNSPNTIIQNDNNFDLQSKSKFDLTPQNSPIILCDATDNKNIQPSFSPNTNTDNAQTPTIITKEVSTSNCNKSPNLERKETIEEITCNKIDIHNLAPSVKLSTPCIEVSLEDIAKCEKKVSNLDPYNTYNLELKNPSPTPSEAFDQIIASCLTDSSTRSSMISDIDIVNTNSNLQHNQKPSNYERCKSIEEILCDKIDIKNLPPSVHLSTTCIDINEDDIKKIEKNQSNLIENPINSPEKQIVKSPETASDILDQILLSNLPDYKPNPKNDNNKIQTKIFENSKISAQSPITVEIPNDGVQKTSEPCPFSPNTMRKLSGIESLMSILNQESELNKSSPTSPSTPLTPQINILDYKSKKSPLSPTTSGVNPLSPISPSSETENFNFSLTKQSQPTTPIEIPKALEMSPTLTKKPPVSPTSPIAIRRGLYQNTQNNKQAVPPSPPKFLYSSKPIAAPRRCPMISDLEEHAGSKTAFIGSPPKSPCETSQTNKSAIFSIGPMQPGAYKNITLLKSEEVPQIRKVSFKEPDTTANITVKSSSGAVNKIRKPVQPAVEKTQNILTDCSLADIENQIIIEKPMPSNTPIPPPRNASSLYKISSAAQNSHNITSPNIQIPINMEKPLNISVNAGESLQKNSPMISPKPKVPPKPDHLKNSPIPLKRSIRPENLDLSTHNQTCNENVSSPTQSTNSGNSTPKTPGVLVAKLEVVETTIKVTSNDNSPQSRPMSPTSIQSSTTTSSSSLPSSPILNRSPLFNKKTHPNYTKTNTNNNSSNSKPKNIFEFIKKNFNNTNENENESDFNLDDKIVVDNSKFYISSDDIGDSTSSSTNISCRSHSDLNNDRDDIDDSNSSNSITICSNQYHQHLPSQQQTNEVNIEIKKIIKTEKIIEKTDNLSPDSNLTAEINQIIDEGIAKLTCDDTKL